MTRFKTTVELPERVLFRTVAGESRFVEVAAIPANVLADLVVGGIIIIGNNTFNGARDSKGAKMTESQKMAAAQKRFDAWYAGNYHITERADNQTALMREAYLSEVLGGDLTPAKIKAAEAQMRARVKEVLGDSVNATFDNFLDATATVLAKRKGEERKAVDIKALLVAKYEAAAADIAAKRAKEAAEVQIDLDDFDI